MPSDAEVLLEQAATWQAQGHGVAIATVVKTWGSSPRPPGSQLVITNHPEGGAFVGSVSGGCIEGAVVTAGLEAIATRTSRLLHFGVTHELAWEVGLACGGQVEVFVQPLGVEGGLTLQTFAELREAIKSRRTVSLVIHIPDGQTRLVSDEGASPSPSLSRERERSRDELSLSRERSRDAPAQPAAESPLPQAGEGQGEGLAQALRDATLRDRPVEIELNPGERLFVQPFCAPVRVFIVGAVHIAQPLSQLCAITGFEVTVIDPRTAFATAQRFPGVTRLTTWPAEALAELGLDRRVAVITLTHDPKLDDPALEAALRSDAFYIGSLGSGKTHQSRLNRLRSRGFGDSDLARIHGPVGLKLGARSPAEIAVSILAQLIGQLRGEPRREPVGEPAAKDA